jgi:5S rRNA maturation endonuclease (ribonuclease M5)
MYIEQDEIFNKTNGGLDIILRYYPQAQDCVDNRNKKFKVRESEKTPSATLKKVDGGVWVVTDFGGDSKPRNGIQLAMEEDKIDFKTAIEKIASIFGISGKAYEPAKAAFEAKPAASDDVEDTYDFEVKNQLSEFELAELGKFVTQEICTRHNLFSLKSFTHIKNRKRLVTSSTEEYPIYLFDFGDWQKIYQPKNPEKQYRFRYVGKRPKDYIFGLKQIEREIADIRKKSVDTEETADGKDIKLDEIIICSGDRDALNVAGMGFAVIWLNSETAKLPEKTYKHLKTLAHEVYNLPDIDKTGIRQAHELAMQYLDLKTIFLPDELREKRDFRGNSCKDLRDFIRYYNKFDFEQLVKIALPYKFWDEEKKVNKNGEPTGKVSYSFNNVQAYNFLMRNGFYRYSSNNEKEGYIFIRVEGNIVRQVESKDVRDFINNFLADRKMPNALRNSFFRTNQLNEQSLSNLPYIEIDFTDFDKDAQFFFFENKTWKVSPRSIQEYKPGEIDKFVWEDEVISHKVKMMEDFFSINQNETGDYAIEIKNKESLFFQYLINTSRVHWRKTDEQQQDLTSHEKYEQDLHLINKIYSLGYLLHRYKNPSRPWCVYAMDNKLSEEGESHGGSGKSIAYNSIRYFMKSDVLNGRDHHLTDNKHIFERVTEHTDFVLIDDANKYLNFSFFYPAITGDLTVNPKNNKQYIIPFKESPKFCITSNYTLRNIDPSTDRRLLYTVFSDYYHKNMNGEYNETRTPEDDFGINLFYDFDEEQWNLFFNFMAQCTKFYLNFEKIDPPMNNVHRRNLLTAMTDVFKDWADVYFSKETDRLDKALVREDCFDEYQRATRVKNTSPQRFKSQLKAWCDFYDYTLNPENMLNKQGRFIRKIRIDNMDVSKEMIFIQTVPMIDPQPMPDDEEGPELPF